MAKIAMKHPRLLGGLAAAAAFALPAVSATDVAITSAVYSGDGSPPQVALATYRAMSAGQSRNYDRAQDISPRQMAILLEVSERTGASLGQALATGEHESARTWNDHVRPTLKNGNLGAATGVWQFQPATFHSIVKKFGRQLLAASEADSATDREHMDLGDGPFTDAQVRCLIQETVDGKRGAEDEELQLLRHNFAVLAFAKHYLSVDTGATTPEEDYLFHFSGERTGQTGAGARTGRGPGHPKRQAGRGDGSSAGNTAGAIRRRRPDGIHQGRGGRNEPAADGCRASGQVPDCSSRAPAGYPGVGAGN